MHDTPQTYPRKESYEAAKAMRESDPENWDIAWRAARAAYDLAIEPSTPWAERKNLVLGAQKLIDEAIVHVRNNPAAYRWAGIIGSEATNFVSSKEAIASAYVIRDNFKQALSLDPYDASAHHLLGRWAYNMAMMPSWQRLIAKSLFGEPPSASLEEARESFERAEGLQPGFWKANQVWLAKTEKALGRKLDATAWAAKAVRLPVVSADDAAEQEEAVKLLGSLDAAAAKAWKEEEAQRKAAAEAKVKARAAGRY